MSIYKCGKCGFCKKQHQAFRVAASQVTVTKIIFYLISSPGAMMTNCFVRYFIWCKKNTYIYMNSPWSKDRQWNIFSIKLYLYTSSSWLLFWKRNACCSRSNHKADAASRWVRSLAAGGRRAGGDSVLWSGVVWEWLQSSFCTAK